MTKKLEMVFNTAQGKTATLSLAAPKPDITREAVAAVMNSIIEKSAFISSSGALTAIKQINIKTSEAVELV